MAKARRARGLDEHRQRLEPLLHDPDSYPSKMLQMLTEHRDLPKLWGMRALDLKFAADTLTTQAGSRLDEYDEAPRSDPELGMTLQPGLATITSLYDTAKMLLGLAFENLIKGIVVSRQPELVKDGTAPGRLVTHAMSALAREEGLVSDPADLQVLRVLERYVVWLGRYPMPLKTDDWLDLIPHQPGDDDPLRFDDERAEALFARLVRHEDMKWYP